MYDRRQTLSWKAGDMRVLIFKLVATPLLIGAISVLGRRFGPTVGGLLVGLPLTSGPVAFFLALDHGASFAASASVGILTGAISSGVFCQVYGHLAFRLRWPATLLLSWGAFLACTALLRGVSLPLLPTYLGVVAAIVVIIALLPRGEDAPSATTSAWWDIPLRMVIATLFVLALTEAAPALGPRLSGLLAPFPLFTTILAVFTHRAGGPHPTARLLRGVAIGLFAFVTFFLIVAALVVPAGVAVAFTSATMVTLAIQGAALWLFGHGPRPGQIGVRVAQSHTEVSGSHAESEVSPRRGNV